MTAAELFVNIKKKSSFLCIGLDTDIKKIPPHLQSSANPVFEFNKRIVDATHDLTVAYKPNIAFYESRGAEGWKDLEMTAGYIRSNYPDIFLIADAKRGDIGNTSKMYASAFFERMDFHAVTVAPYMGEDSVMPFLGYEGKWIIILAVTSNAGANDFQFLPVDENGLPLFKKLLSVAAGWGNTDNTMFVAGATRPEVFSEIRTIVPDHFLLVPGIGAQGGSLEQVVNNGMNSSCGLIVNSSRSIIFADSSTDFAVVAREKALELQQEMAGYIS